jgi:hypothetical protein
VSYAEFLFEGLCAMKRLNRSEEKGYFREATEEESALYRQVQQGKVSLS